MMTYQFPREVVLDPHRQQPDDTQHDRYTIVTTERALLETLGTGDRPLWICGEFLCQWAKTWLRSWEYPDAQLHTYQSPRQRLQQAIPQIEIPDTWDEAQCLTFLDRLDAVDPSMCDPIVILLSSISDRDVDFWQAETSHTHLAEWLTIKLPETYRPLEQFWQQRRPPSTLFDFYQVASNSEKYDLLRCWLGITDRCKPPILGTFPIVIPTMLETEFRNYWERQLLTSKGECLDRIDPEQQPGFEQIAQLSLKLFEQQPDYITAPRSHKLRPVFSLEENQKLDTLTPPARPEPLPADASTNDTLDWITQRYLPYRRWETTRLAKSASDRRHSCDLAGSFVDWIYNNYPRLKAIPVAESPLNYRATHTAIDLSQTAPVFWVVVDGLGWLDHCELISLLAERNLHVERDLTPTFSILPTTTQYAKWGLYAQQTPRGDRWSNDIKSAFASIGRGQHYTDGQTSQLERDLQNDKHPLYCWDTTMLDKLYHSPASWDRLYKVDRPSELKKIANLIDHFINLHPNSESVQVVIASDHGQLFGECAARIPKPPDLETCGRIAQGRSDDPRFLTLDRDTFDLPEDLSIVRGEASFNSYRYSHDNETNGAHGGLFPEEVTIGFSCLRLHPTRNIPIVTMTGTGEAGKPGAIHLEVYNSNTVTLRDVTWEIDPKLAIDLPDCLPPGLTKQEIAIKCFPDLEAINDSNTRKITGEIRFRYDHGSLGQAAIDTRSQLTIERLSTNDIDLSDFGF
jgi:hypothetical protein